MALSPRDGAIAGFVAFIAWRLVISWIPALNYLAWACFAGSCIATISISALVLFTSRGRQHERQSPSKLPRIPAIANAEIWKVETEWLAQRATYKPDALYPSSFVISNSLDSLLNWLFRDLISTWYQNIAPSSSFVNEVDRATRVTLINLRDRLLALDIVAVAVSRIIPLFTSHLKDFYEAERAIRGKNLNRNVTESEELDIAIAGKYREGKLHPAASLAYSDMKIVQQEYMRNMVEKVLPEVLPQSMVRSRVVFVLIREILAGAVLAPLMQILSDPDSWNQLLEAYGRATLQDRKTVRKLRAALDQHASPAPKSAKLQNFPRLSAGDDQRKFERFVRAIRQCNNLSDARRFRSEVASQLKRESMLDGQGRLYLRRLETGKQLLDQRVGTLSAVGGASPARLSYPKSINGHVSSRTADVSIIEVLHNSSGLSYFMEYMDRQQLMTLIQFWLVVEGFRNPLEEDIFAENTLSTSQSNWTDADRTDIAQIYEAYLSKPELNVSENARSVIRTFLRAGPAATGSQYLQARSVILRTQSTVLEIMKEKHFPSFKKSDLYYKYLTSDESASTAMNKLSARASRFPSVESIPESPSKPLSVSRTSSSVDNKDLGVGRDGASSMDLFSGKLSEPVLSLQSRPRNSFEVNTSGPLFDDDVESEALSQSKHSIDNESIYSDQGDTNREQMVVAMEAALNDIMTSDPKDEDLANARPQPLEPGLFGSKHIDSSEDSYTSAVVNTAPNGKGRARPNLASLGLVNTSSRIGVFSDNDLFDDEEKFIEDEHLDSEEYSDGKEVNDEIHQAAPGDLGLAEAISALTIDIERLVAQDSVVETLTRKAELTNNVAELRILGKSKSSLEREIRRKELQRQQYIVQESDNSLYGQANVEIKSIMVGKDDDGQEYALYVVEVQRKASEHIPTASWAVAKRYSEFHHLHQRLRRIYPAVRHLEFPRRRLVMKLQREFLDRRRLSLQKYLRELLQLPAVCRSRDLRAFLSQQAILSTAEMSRDEERRDIVSRIYDSVTDGMDEYIGNLPVLDQLSIAGQNLISAATSQFGLTTPSAHIDTTASPTDDDLTFHSAEARAELLAFENRDDEPFVKPICDLFLETFELNRSNNWLRGRAVVVVLHQLLGGTVERKIRDAAHALTSEASVLRAVDLLMQTFWPPGGSGPLRRDFPPRTELMKQRSRQEASVVLAALIPDLAGNVVGRANAKAASRRLLATVNNQRLNSHLAFSVLDEVLAILFPAKR